MRRRVVIGVLVAGPLGLLPEAALASNYEYVTRSFTIANNGPIAITVTNHTDSTQGWGFSVWNTSTGAAPGAAGGGNLAPQRSITSTVNVTQGAGDYTIQVHGDVGVLTPVLTGDNATEVADPGDWTIIGPRGTSEAAGAAAVDASNSAGSKADSVAGKVDSLAQQVAPLGDAIAGVSSSISKLSKKVSKALK